jgi:hypothetical protein
LGGWSGRCPRAKFPQGHLLGHFTYGSPHGTRAQEKYYQALDVDKLASEIAMAPADQARRATNEVKVVEDHCRNLKRLQIIAHKTEAQYHAWCALGTTQQAFTAR